MQKKNDDAFFVITRDLNDLCHYGTVGMKRGVWGGPSKRYQNHAVYARGNPRYADKVKQQKAIVDNLLTEMNKDWDYGVIENGKKLIYDDELDNYDWSKYRTTPVDKLKDSKCGVCWDFVNYQHDIFKKNGIKDESYFLLIKNSDDDDDSITHTFSVVDIGGQKYWFESSDWGNRGLHKIDSFEDVIKIKAEQNYGYTKDSFWYGAYKYNPEGLDKGISGNEFVKRVTSSGNEVANHVYEKI